MNSALGIVVVFDFITLIAVERGLEIFVDVVGMVDSVCTVFVIGYWLFDVGIVGMVDSVCTVFVIGYWIADKIVSTNNALGRPSKRDRKTTS